MCRGCGETFRGNGKSFNAMFAKFKRNGRQKRNAEGAVGAAVAEKSTGTPSFRKERERMGHPADESSGMTDGLKPVPFKAKADLRWGAGGARLSCYAALESNAGATAAIASALAAGGDSGWEL